MNHLIISFDDMGNLYFTNNKSNVVYQIEISKNNTIQIDNADYSIVNKANKYLGKIIKLPEKDSKKQNEEIEFDDYYSNSIPLSLYPEEQGYLFSNEKITNVNIADNFFDGEYEDQFDSYSEFLFYGNDFPIHVRKNGYYNALYDTFIISNDNILFRTKLIGEPPLYIIVINTDDNTIKFRDTTNFEYYTSYKIVTEDTNISLIKN